MNRIDRALNKFFDFSTVRGNIRWLLTLVTGLLVIWFIQDILSYVYDLFGGIKYERNENSQRHHRVLGVSLVSVGIVLAGTNICLLLIKKRR
ncbi:hypothetical protein LCGC14_0192490 [marine sediment metagenome]|uniref:Uncharacterized protein n=1 Tax=marine sediment metagenome TaxID=412755 RepID=A0A0F9UL67_9ZZZZ